MYIFLDESGKPEVFSSKGVNLVETGMASRHLVIATVKTTNHIALQNKINDFKSQLLNDPTIQPELSAAYALDSFHASPDKKIIRERFYRFIADLDDIEVHVIVAEKLKCKQKLQKNPIRLYGLLSGLILHGIAHQDSKVEVVFSRQDNGKKVKEQLELEVERIREHFWAQHKKPPTGINLNYQHNPHYSHAGLQIADYVAYAIFKHFETGDSSNLKIIKKKIRHIYHFNTKEHFTRSNPLKLS